MLSASRRELRPLLGFFVVGVLLLSACGSGATATSDPAQRGRVVPIGDRTAAPVVTGTLLDGSPFTSRD